MQRIPADPDGYDPVKYVDCAVCSFSPAGRMCPRMPNGDAPSGLACDYVNRPERQHVMYAPRKIFGNEEN